MVGVSKSLTRADPMFAKEGIYETQSFTRYSFCSTHFSDGKPGHPVQSLTGRYRQLRRSNPPPTLHRCNGKSLLLPDCSGVFYGTDQWHVCNHLQPIAARAPRAD